MSFGQFFFGNTEIQNCVGQCGPVVYLSSQLKAQNLHKKTLCVETWGGGGAGWFNISFSEEDNKNKIC
jgi:hypothetical protein